MIAAPVVITMNFGEFKRNIARVRSRIARPRVYLEHWFAEGHPQRIQTQWFDRGQVEPGKLPPTERSWWLNRTVRQYTDFYAQVHANHGSYPAIRVRHNWPRWVWTKNTLRSTFEPVRWSVDRAEIVPKNLENRFDAAFYDRHGGPFVDQIEERGGRPWDMEGLERSAVDEIEGYITSDVKGTFFPRRFTP